MRLNLRLWDPASGREDHVVVTAEREARVADVTRGRQDIQPGPLSVRDRPLSGDGTLGGGPLRDGDVVVVGGPGPANGSPPVTGLELAVVGGPEAGRVWPLPSGTRTGGRAAGSDFRLHHPTVSPP